MELEDLRLCRRETRNLYAKCTLLFQAKDKLNLKRQKPSRKIADKE
jgi:hypothetical protein